MIRQPRNSHATNRGWVNSSTGELLVAISGLLNKLNVVDRKDREDKLKLAKAEPGPFVADPIKDEGATREQQIIDAIALLDPNNEDHFTKSGLPSVEQLEDLLEFDISAKERTKIWKSIN